MAKWLMVPIVIACLAAAPASQPADSPDGAAPKAPPRVGLYTANFTEHPEIASLPSVFNRCLTSSEVAQIKANVHAKFPGQVFPQTYVDLATATWKVYVPEDYTGEIPYGLVVWINSTDDGSPPANWLPVLKKHRLIWVGADKSGNDQPPPTFRIPLTLYGCLNMRHLYRIDSDRVYVSGLSGGGRCASWVAADFADVFSGGFYIVGCNDFPQRLPTPMPAVLQIMRTRNRYVFLSGDNDMNLGDTKLVMASYRQQGVRNTTFLQVPKMGHENPPADWYEKGIVALDEPLCSGTPRQLTEARKLESSRNSVAALRLYAQVAGRAQDGQIFDQAIEKVRSLQPAYEQEIADIRAQLAGHHILQAAAALDRFERAAGDYGSADSAALAEEIRAAKAHKKPDPSTAASGPSSSHKIDLLALIDPTRDAIEGDWQLDHGQLIGNTPSGPGRLRIPYSPPAEYDFRIEFTRTGGNTVLQMLSHDRHSFKWVIDFEGHTYGFDSVGGHQADDNPTHLERPNFLHMRERCTSIVKIRRNSITTVINGEVFTNNYRTDYSDFSMQQMWDVGNDCLGVGTLGNHVIFHVIELTEISGSGKKSPPVK